MDFDEILNAPPKSILSKASDVFFYRIGYFTMTRLLLVRAWEDIGFVDQTLYNGGLAKWYQTFNKEKGLVEVLEARLNHMDALY